MTKLWSSPAALDDLVARLTVGRDPELDGLSVLEFGDGLALRFLFLRFGRFLFPLFLWLDRISI